MKKTLFWSLSLLVIGLILIFAFTGHDFIGLALCFIAAVILLMSVCGRTAKRIICAVLAVGLLYFCIVEVPIVKNSLGSEDFDGEYIIVLGAAVHGDRPSLSLVERMSAAYDYLSSHPDAAAILSGGQGADENLSEAQAMYDYLTARGIDGGRLIREDKSASTYENLRNSFEIIRENGGEPDGNCAVVSSEYHLCRARLIAEGLGVRVSVIPARTTYLSVRLNYFIREAFGVTYQWIFGTEA